MTALPDAATRPPDWSAGTLASVLPSVADRLGVSRYAGRDVFDLPAVPRTVVVLVDGLGHDLLRQRSGHAPFLRSHLGTAVRVPCGFPSTTATSMGTFGTVSRIGRAAISLTSGGCMGLSLTIPVLR